MTHFTIGPTLYIPAGCVVDLNVYAVGRALCLVIRNPRTMEQETVATTNMVGEPLLPYCLWLKGWAENQRLPKALEVAGVLTLTGRKHPAGYAYAEEAVLTQEFIDAHEAFFDQYPDLRGTDDESPAQEAQSQT